VRATGKEFKVPAVHVWTSKSGKTLRFEAYIANLTMRKALGVGGPDPAIQSSRS
jgi:hypothetical protein